MINKNCAEKYCKEYWKIENYQEAVNDPFQMWDCHHRREIDWILSKEELISIGRYYGVHYSELIFIPHDEHARLHTKGKPKSAEQKHNMSKYMMGRFCGEKNHNYKYHITKEELYKLYVEDNLTLKQIMELYGCSKSALWNKLKKFNISKSKS